MNPAKKVCRERDPGMPLIYDKEDLHSLMRTCGRYLYLRSGTGGGQGRILAILLNRKSMTQKELLAVLGVRPGSLSEILAKLEEKGLIRRRKDEADKRRCILELTEAGVDAAMFREKEEDGRPAFGALNGEEQADLKRLLRKLLEDWIDSQDEEHTEV